MKRNQTRNRLRPSSSLILTSLMDILTVLVLFLLKSFVMEGEAVTTASCSTVKWWRRFPNPRRATI